MEDVPLLTAPVMPAGILQVQLKFAPVVADVSVMAADVDPEQMVCLGRENCILGAGFTVMVKLMGKPLHNVPSGVMLMVAVRAVVPVLMALKAGMFPEPLAANPMPLLLFVQE